MSVVTSTISGVGRSGVRRRVKTLTYHCSQCGQFVYSEDEPKDDSSRQMNVRTQAPRSRGKPDPMEVDRPDAPITPGDSEAAEEPVPAE